MSKIKTVSSKEIIARVKRDFHVKHSGWEYDALEWIGDGLEIIGAEPVYEKCHNGFKVSDHRLKVPCPVDYISEVRVIHNRDDWDYSTNMIRDCKESSIRIACINGNRKHKHLFVDPNAAVLSPGLPLISDTNMYAHEWYELGLNYLRFSFRHGKVIIVYEGIPLDEEGFPCVVDDIKVKNALAWYILRGLLLRGYKHPVINFDKADAEWTKFYPQAQNSVKMPTPDEMAFFKSNFTDLCRGITREWRSFD